MHAIVFLVTCGCVAAAPMASVLPVNLPRVGDVLIMIEWLALAAAILFNTLGNFFIKRFSVATEVQGVLDYLSPSFVLGLAFFGLNLVLYARALTGIPLALAYPILVGSTVAGVAGIAAFWFGEQLGVAHLLGLALVTAGIALLAGTT